MMLTGRGVGLACFASLFGNKLLGLLRFEVCLGVRLGGLAVFFASRKKGQRLNPRLPREPTPSDKLEDVLCLHSLLQVACVPTSLLSELPPPHPSAPSRCGSQAGPRASYRMDPDVGS